MAETIANPPAANAGLTVDQVKSIIAEAIGPITTALGSLGENQKVLADTLKALPPAAKADDAGKKDEAAALTPEAVTKIVTDAILADRKAQQTTGEQQQARQKFADTRLKNLPAAYRDRLGNDPTKWETEAAALAEAFKADMAALKITVPNVGGESSGGQSPQAVQPDLSKLSDQQLMAMGYNQSKAGEAAGATGAAM